jgi:transcriptional regulator with XRE-family HTH domain
MPRRPIDTLGPMVRKKRGSRKLRETAKEIGIGSATLMRIESGRIPDVETFGKLCDWLGENPAAFLGLKELQQNAPSNQTAVTFAGHFKSDRTPNLQTVEALAKMMLLASRSQPNTEEPEN